MKHRAGGAASFLSGACSCPKCLIFLPNRRRGKTRPSPVAAIILAAGKSTRMRSKLPKPLHPLCGLPMTGHVIRACREAGVERVVVVVGHEAEKVREGLGDGVEYALQSAPRGTGDAVRAAQSLLGDWTGTILVLAGDIPLLPAESLRHLIGHQQGSGASATLLTAFLDDPTGYGRVVRDTRGQVARIVEEKDATPDERALREWNPSIYAFDGPELWTALGEVQPNNAQGEYYLTDTVGILVQRGKRLDAVPVADSRYVLGVNNRVELAAVTASLRERILNGLMLSGVSIIDPASTYIEVDVEIGQDTTIEPEHLSAARNADCGGLRYRAEHANREKPHRKQCQNFNVTGSRECAGKRRKGRGRLPIFVPARTSAKT